MLFTEPLFFAFFAVVFAVYWSLRRHRARKLWLLAGSYVFYGAWDWRFLGLIFASTMIDFVVGIMMPRSRASYGRRAWLLVSICGNLGLLGFFKYFDFFVTSFNPLFEWMGLGGARTLGIVLPVGISFYTFQTMSYTIDIYRRRMEPVRNFADFALFVSFFPQLVMGPILRAIRFIPQLAVSHRFEDVPVKAMLSLFVIGFVKKACVSDNIAPVVEAVYADPTSFGVLGVWIAVVLYAIQLYCDFSGYADMAIAIAGLLGYRVATNFDFPFFASNITEFWRRWHISFSSWLRDYLYFSMGGSRGTQTRTYMNLMITMLLSGLWHGAGWNFIAWGGLNGLGLIVHRFYARASIPAALRSLTARLGVLMTFYWFAFTLIFFRSQTTDQALFISRTFLTWESSGSETLWPWMLLWLLPLGVAHFAAMKVDLPARAERLDGRLFALVFGAVVAIVLACVRLEYRPFIYFQF
jgi:alginate O-acetyltransferase complex protein AlgI